MVIGSCPPLNGLGRLPAKARTRLTRVLEESLGWCKGRLACTLVILDCERDNDNRNAKAGDNNYDDNQVALV